jgi:hypothetical protein
VRGGEIEGMVGRLEFLTAKVLGLVTLEFE